MAANRLKSPHLRFGPFHLDEADQLILREGKPLALPPKAFDTLVYLAQNCQRLVTRDELMKAVWPNSYVGDGSLSVNISVLRRLLGEMEDGQPYIETVPRKGYRFRPRVIVEPAPDELSPAALGEDTLDPEVTENPPLSPVASRVSVRAVLATVSLLLTLGGILYVAERRHRGTPSFATMLISRLAARGNITDAAISPDGKYVAYALDEPQGQSLWVRQITAPSDVRIVAAEAGDHSSLTFSPDGEYLYYVRSSKAGDRILYRQHVFGGDGGRKRTHQPFAGWPKVGFRPNGSQPLERRFDGGQRGWERTAPDRSA